MSCSTVLFSVASDVVSVACDSPCSVGTASADVVVLLSGAVTTAHITNAMQSAEIISFVHSFSLYFGYLWLKFSRATANQMPTAVPTGGMTNKNMILIGQRRISGSFRSADDSADTTAGSADCSCFFLKNIRFHLLYIHSALDTVPPDESVSP